MTDTDDGELEVPDFYDPESECRAWRAKPAVIGADTHTHICRRYPEHELPHVCHSCGATWGAGQAAA
jgi:hypothetical protein